METKVIKYLVAFTMSIVLSISVTACKSEDDTTENSYIPSDAISLSNLTTANLEADGVTLMLKDGMRVTGVLNGEKQKVKLVIADGATVVLHEVKVNGYHHSNDECQWAGITCAGNATIVLADGTENVIKGFNKFYSGIEVPEGKTLTIRSTSGKLTACCNGNGAGIGGIYNTRGVSANRDTNGFTCGNIHIEGGIITAIGGQGAGIGSGWGGGCGDIIITGGTVTATGGHDAAGIGSSYGGNCGNISIIGGTVTASAGLSDGSAGIGGGIRGVCGNISITGGIVTVKGIGDGAAIGCGYGDWAHPSSCGNITISGGIVTAIKGDQSPYSIGKSIDDEPYHSICGSITIGGIVYYDGTKFLNDNEIALSTNTFDFPSK